MTHYIDIEQAVEEIVANLLGDPDGRAIETERDDLLAVIYAWQAEQADRVPTPLPPTAAATGAGTEAGGE